MLSEVVEKRINVISTISDELGYILPRDGWNDYAAGLLARLQKLAIIFDDESDFVKKVFVVYNSEGQPFNPIISKTLIYRKQPVTIAPGEKFKRCLIWPWDLVPLPRGKYTSPCTIDIEEICNETYTANFEII